MRLQQLAYLVSIITIVQAWPWPPSFGGKAIEGVGDIFKRQNNGGGQATATQTVATQTNSGNNNNNNQGTSTGTASITGTQTQGTGTARVSASQGNSTSATEYDPRDPAGGVSMVTPNPTLGSQIYKIGDWVHFAWNYTSLQASPSAINIVASCSQNQATYTLAMNQSFQETGEVYWDTGNYQKTAVQQLLTNQYTLVIYDAAGDVTQTARPGYLGSYSGFVFGMYTPQAYTPWSDYRCPTCVGSGALSSMEKMTLTFLFGTATITVLTFSWFVTSLHVI